MRVTGSRTIDMSERSESRSSSRNSDRDRANIVTGVRTIRMDSSRDNKTSNSSGKNYSSNGSNRNNTITGVKTIVMDNNSSKSVTNTTPTRLVTGAKIIVTDNHSSKPVANTAPKGLVTGVKTIVMDKPNSASLPTYKPTSHTIAKINYFTHKILESTKIISSANSTSQPPHTVKQIERLTKELAQLIAKDESQKKIDIVINNIKFYSKAMNNLNRSIGNDIFTNINHISTTLKQNNLNNITSSQINKQPPNITNTVSTLVTNNLPKLKLTAEEARALAMDASYATVVDKNNNLLPQRGIENILQQMFNNESKEKLADRCGPVGDIPCAAPRFNGKGQA